MKTDHLLIMRFSGLGDVAMTVPLVWSLARRYPHLRITVLSSPFARVLFDNMAPNVGFMEADLKNEYRGVKGLNALYRRLTAKQFTAIADLHNVLRSGYLRMRFNIDRYRVEHIDKHRRERRQLVATTGKQLVQLPSVFELYADVLARLGYPVDMEFDSMFPPTGGNIRLISPLVGEKKPFQQWIGIAPFAKHPGKIYPLEQMEQVVAALSQREDVYICLLGARGKEEKLLQQWEAHYPHTECIAGKYSLDKELALINRLDLLICMDSANMHFASLVHTPVLSIWGATHPYAGFYGYHQKPEYAVQLPMLCRPCSIFGQRPCLRGDWACLKGIDPTIILNKVDYILSLKS